MSEMEHAVGDAMRDLGKTETVDDPVERFIKLRDEKQRIEDMLNPVKAELRDVERQIADDFLRLGKTKETRHGVTVYVARHLTAKVLDPEALREYMGEHGLASMLTVHSSRLNAWLREVLRDEHVGEWVADSRRLPESIRDAVAVEEYHKIQARRS